MNYQHCVNNSQAHCINNKLYYTVENILGELAGLICYTQNMPDEITYFYKELQKMSMDLEAAVSMTAMTADEAADEFTDMYQDVLDVYVEHLLEEHKKMKK